MGLARIPFELFTIAMASARFQRASLAETARVRRVEKLSHRGRAQGATPLGNATQLAMPLAQQKRHILSHPVTPILRLGHR